MAFRYQPNRPAMPAPQGPRRLGPPRMMGQQNQAGPPGGANGQLPLPPGQSPPPSPSKGGMEGGGPSGGGYLGPPQRYPQPNPSRQQGIDAQKETFRQGVLGGRQDPASVLARMQISMGRSPDGGMANYAAGGPTRAPVAYPPVPTDPWGLFRNEVGG